MTLGRTSGFVIEWPVTFSVRDGRVFTVARTGDGALRIRAGTDDWRDMGQHHVPSIGAAVGSSLRWWFDTTGERLFLTRSA